MRLNGVDSTPGAGEGFVVDQNDGWLLSASTVASLLDGALPLHSGKLDVPVYRQPMFTVNLTTLLGQYAELASLLNLAGFHINGKMTVSLASGGASQVKGSIQLPSSFTNPGGGTVTSRRRPT